jgi:hypothetical protein
MSRYDGLIIPRSYSEYINKTDATTLQQALQLSGVLSNTVAAGDNKAVKSAAVNTAINAIRIIRNRQSIKAPTFTIDLTPLNPQAYAQLHITLFDIYGGAANFIDTYFELRNGTLYTQRLQRVSEPFTITFTIIKIQFKIIFR